jgi:hypothetical protein
VLDRLADSIEWPGVVVSLPFLVIAAAAHTVIWATFLDLRPIAAVGPRPPISAEELHARVMAYALRSPA